MTKLTAATLERFGSEPGARREQREAALATFHETGLPDLETDVWRYAPLEQLKLDELELAPWDPEPPGEVADATVEVLDGKVSLVGVLPEGLTLELDATPEDLGTLVGAADPFSALNLALCPGVLHFVVAAGRRIEQPVRLRVRASAGVSFPRVFVRLDEGSSLRLVEHVTGGDAQLVVPVGEFVVGDGASLELTSVQALGAQTWSIGRTRVSLGRDAACRQLVLGLGGRYDRVRADARLEGEGASSTLHTAHVGTADQVHDLRTMQVHVGRATTSRLYSRAAVSGNAESIYSGLIAMRPGARRADARQANQSLVLSEGARADAVPNLDIQENDVRCSHASSVGPVDEEQRWYLESRGVEPHDAVRLIVEGFFAEIGAMLRDDELAADLRAAIARLEAGMTPMGAGR